MNNLTRQEVRLLEHCKPGAVTHEWVVPHEEWLIITRVLYSRSLVSLTEYWSSKYEQPRFVARITEQGLLALESYYKRQLN